MTSMSAPDIAVSDRRFTLGAVWRDLLRSRELVTQLTLRDLRLRYKQAVFGVAWAILMPILLIGAGLVIRIAAFKHADPGTAPSLGGIAIKGWAWAFFAGGMNFATTSVLNNVQLVTKIYFPREILPVAAIITQVVDASVGAGVLLLLSPLLHFTLSWALLWLPVLIVLMIAFTLGLGFLFACANLFFRDVKYILQVILTFGMLFTPVLFTLASFGPKARLLLLCNPLSPILEGYEVVTVNGASLLSTLPAHDGGLPLWSPYYLLYSVLFIAVLLPWSVLIFRRSSTQFAEFY
ncbi:MAG TPA: ABC transporter permease [Gemmatimonadales bacterium]|jgi:ABC-type polysaccharide/polyol phosphate export permease